MMQARALRVPELCDDHTPPSCLVAYPLAKMVYKFDNALLGLGPRDQTAHLPVFLHLRTTNLPGPSSVMRSEQAQQRRFERRHNKHERMQRRRS